MRKVLLIMGLLIILSIPVYASNAMKDKPLTVTVNGTNVVFTDAKPFVDSANRTQVPVKVVMESFNAEVSWDADRNTVVINKNGNVVELTIGEKYIVVNSEKKEIDTAAQVYNQRTYLPIRAVVEALGGEVGWDEATQTVQIKSGELESNYSQENLNETTDIISYESFRDMFEYEGLPQEDYIWVYATYNGDLGKSEFEKLWNSIPERNKEIYMRKIAFEKQSKNAEYAITINFCYGRSGPFVEENLGSSSCTVNGKSVAKPNNISDTKINPLN